MANYFTVSPESLVGNVYETDFVLNATLPTEYTQFTWDFGNGLFDYNVRTTSVTYQYPGVYRISLSAWNDSGFLLTDFAEVNVDYVHRDVLLFTQLPTTYGTPSMKSDTPFTVELTSAKIDQPISVILQAFNTNSVPHYAVPEKWNFIVPRWRFVDAETDKNIDSALLLKTDPIYRNNKVVAVSGKASFYYVDDLASTQGGCPLLIAATLSTLNFSYPTESLRYPYYSYSNTEVARAVISWQINETIPTRLIVTENYLNDIYPIKWSTIPIPVMVTCEFDPVLIDEFGNSAVQPSKVLSYPKTNELGKINRVKMVLSGESGLIPEDLYTVEVDGVSYSSSNAPLYFQSQDNQNNSVNGYIFTTITPKVPLSSSVVVAVSTIAANQQNAGSTSAFAFPDGYPINNNIYVSHPFESTINKINIVTYSSTGCSNVDYYKDLGLLIEGSASFIDVPRSTSFDAFTYEISGAGGIYAMAFDPVSDKLYAADADQDVLYVLNGGSAVSNTVKLSSFTGKQYNVPSYLSIDRFYNIWIALYGQELLLKLDPALNLILSAVPNSPLGLSAEGSLFVAPPIVETDSSNNVWASYAHPLSSTVIKFDGSTGQELFRLTDLPLSSVPVSLTLNPENNLWVACRESNKVQLHSTLDGSLLKTVDGLLRPSYIMCDRASNLWITHGYNFCSKYNPNTDEIKHYKIDNINKTISEVVGYTPQDIQKALYENEIWGGLTVDVFDKVWVVDSEQNTAYVFNSPDPLTTLNSFNLMPKADTNYVIIGGTNYVTEISEEKVRSAQAAGDWSGNRWYQKYSGSYSSLPVLGKSTPFTVYDLDTSFTVAKVNEEFNCAEYFKSLALPEILKENEALFDEFLAAVVGNGNPTKEDIGRVAYERIANFVQTHGDFETSEIKQLLSFAEQLSVPAKTFGNDFPAEISRLLNLFSVPKHKLRGQIAYESDLSKNVGPLLTESSYVSAGQFIFVKDRFYDNFQLIAVNPLSSGNILIDIQDEKEILTLDGRPMELPSPATNYALSSIQVEGLRTPLFDNYYFFEYNEEKIGYKGNIINWDSDFTAIDYDFSTYNQWYGDEGLVETTFNNILTKRLILDN